MKKVVRSSFQKREIKVNLYNLNCLKEKGGRNKLIHLELLKKKRRRERNYGIRSISKEPFEEIVRTVDEERTSYFLTFRSCNALWA